MIVESRRGTFQKSKHNQRQDRLCFQFMAAARITRVNPQQFCAKPPERDGPVSHRLGKELTKRQAVEQQTDNNTIDISFTLFY